jgi:hypothetical protein
VALHVGPDHENLHVKPRVELGKILMDFKVNSAVEQIRKAVAEK